MTRSFLTCLVLATLAGFLPAQGSLDVYGALDRGQDAVLAALEPETLIAALKAGRDLPAREAFEEKRRLQDLHGRETDLYLIVPEKPRGALFLLHGLGGDGRQLKNRLFRRFAAAERLIIAAPTAQREPDQAPNEDASGRSFLHWWSYQEGNFVLAALAALKREFPLDENRTYLCGYSMGGFGTWNIGLRYPDRFAALVAMAGGISRREYFPGERPSPLRRLLVNARHLPIYALHGARDRTVPAIFDRLSNERLQELGYPMVYVEVEKGGHLLRVGEGGELMTAVQSWLRGRVRAAHPREIRFHSLHPGMAWCYWVRLDAYAARPAEIQAKIGQENSIEVSTEGVSRLTLFLDETHLDLVRPIRVEVNGQEVFHGRAMSSAAVVLESWRARQDRELLYRAKVEVDVP